jgi:hypothetical protein
VNGVVIPQEHLVFVKRLDVIVYTDGGRSWHTESTVRPSWSLIEQSIRRLDKFAHPFLFLCLSETQGDEDERLEIMGGDGDYWVAGTFDGYFQRRLVNQDGGDGEIEVWTSDQGFGDAERYICHDVEEVVRVARHFFDHRGFDLSVIWEDQPRQ